LQSSHDIGSDWQLDLIWRYVDDLPGLDVPAYGVMDVRLAWEPTDSAEVYVVGRNLLDRAHPEFTTGEYEGTFATEVEREVYGGIALRY
jgi:iron complex outermembrane receptor protein